MGGMDRTAGKIASSFFPSFFWIGLVGFFNLISTPFSSGFPSLFGGARFPQTLSRRFFVQSECTGERVHVTKSHLVLVSFM